MPHSLTKSSTNPKSAQASAHTQNRKPQPHGNLPCPKLASLPTKSTRRVRNKKPAYSSAQLSELQALDEFVDTVIDPDKHLNRYPLNRVDSAVARQVINVIGNTYSDENSVNLYVTNDPEYPAAISVRASKNYPVNTHPSLVITQPVSTYGNLSTPVYSPIILDNTLLFNAPVSFGDGSTRPGYHMSVTGAALSFTVSHSAGLTGTFTTWHRTPADTYVSVDSTVSANIFVTTAVVPTNATAFGFYYNFSQNTVDRLVIATAKNTASEISIGNHASYAIKMAIPDLQTMRVRQARTLGIKSHVCFEGEALHNAGRIASAQFPPGVYPGQYAGKNAYEQIKTARLRQSYWGRFDKGAVSRFLPPSEDSFKLGPEPKRYGEDGFIVMSWYCAPGYPQPYEVTITLAIEFTTPSTAFQLAFPHFSEVEFVNHAHRILSVMCLHTENPLHDLIKNLWDDLKRQAKKVVTSPDAWFTIAKVAGAAALAL